MNIKKILTNTSESVGRNFNAKVDDVVLDELADKTLKFIGLMSEKDDGLEAFVNLVITVKDGKIVDLERLSPAYDNSGAINEATAWIDTHYWNHRGHADE